MKKLIVLTLLFFLSAAKNFAQEIHVTIDGQAAPSVKDRTVIVGKNNLLSNARLVVVPNIGTVQSFDMSMLPVRGEYAGPTSSKSAEMTEEHKTWIKRCKYGDRFFFENITLKLRDGRIKHLDSAAFIVLIQ